MPPPPALSPSKDRSPPRRVSALVALVLAAAAGTSFLFLTGFSHSGPAANVALRASGVTLDPALDSAEARRLLRLLRETGDRGQTQGQAAQASGFDMDPASSPLMVMLAEKNVQCERALTSLKGSPRKEQAEKDSVFWKLQQENKRLEEGTKKLQAEVENLQEENKKLQGGNKVLSSQVEASSPDKLKLQEELRKLQSEMQKLQDENKGLTGRQELKVPANSDCDCKTQEASGEASRMGSKKLEVPSADPQVLVEVENLKKENQALKDAAEASKGSASDELVALKKQVEELTTQKQQLQQQNQQSSPAIPGLSKDTEKEALAAAKKVLEQCGAKQGSPQQAAAGGKHYACQATVDEIKQYLNYTPRAECPDDWYFVLKLVYIKSCFCLPKRRCFAPSPPNYKEPTIPFPRSLFDPKVLQNENVRWNNMYWPSYEAINNRTWGDCRDCFNLTLEATRWQVNFQGTIPIEYMLSLKGKGAIKIGLDAGGGTGSFAAKMAEHNVTIVTTAMNTETLGDRDGGLPYMETIAQRGLIPLFLPHKVRQPFFDGTLDLVHNINSIKYFTMLEFEELLFEWDRILRPGGVMWFELFYAPVAEMPLYISVIEMFGYKKLYWNMTPKTDAAERRELPHVYLNCVLEKPRRKDGFSGGKSVTTKR